MMGVALTLCVSACGSQAATTPPAQTLPLTGSDILAKPQSSGLSDAHFTLTEHLPSGATGTGDGVLVYKPQPATRMTARYPSTVPGATLTVDTLIVAGTFYTRGTPGDGVWTATDGPWNLAAGRAREHSRHIQCGPTGADRDALASEFQQTHKLAGVPPEPGSTEPPAETADHAAGAESEAQGHA